MLVRNCTIMTMNILNAMFMYKSYMLSKQNHLHLKTSCKMFNSFSRHIYKQLTKLHIYFFQSISYLINLQYMGLTIKKKYSLGL